MSCCCATARLGVAEARGILPERQRDALAGLLPVSAVGVTYRCGVRYLIPRFGNTWEQLAFDGLDRLTMRGIDDVRFDVQRRLNARVSELLLCDFHGHFQIVQESRVNVAELMLRHPSKPCVGRRWL